MTAGFLALGDSYTIGEGVRVRERWPVQLVDRLCGEGILIGAPEILAVTGWTTGELARAMDARTLNPPYALVTLLIGVNDQYRGRPLDGYRVQFRELLHAAVALAGGAAERTVVVSIPDWGATPFASAEGRDGVAVAAAIDAFNAAAHAEAVRAGAHWVDVTGISRSCEARGELSDDRLHPSGAQYARWVDVIAPVARVVLKAS